MTTRREALTADQAAEIRALEEAEKSPRTVHRGATLSPAEAAEIRALVQRVGERSARLALLVSSQTLARAIGLMYLQRATVTHLRSRLAKIPTVAA